MRGIGGLEKDCWGCDATGKVEQKSGCKTVDLLPDATKIELVSLEDIFPGVTEIAKEIEAEKIAAIEPISAPEPIIESIEPKAIFPGYSDELMTALLEEHSMAGPEWKQKYKNVKELFITRDGQIIGEILDVRSRASIREMYAQSKPAAPRKVDLAAMQDAVANVDAEYARYDKQEKAKS